MGSKAMNGYAIAYKGMWLSDLSGYLSGDSHFGDASGALIFETRKEAETVLLSRNMGENGEIRRVGVRELGVDAKTVKEAIIRALQRQGNIMAVSSNHTVSTIGVGYLAAASMIELNDYHDS